MFENSNWWPKLPKYCHHNNLPKLENIISKFAIWPQSLQLQSRQLALVNLYLQFCMPASKMTIFNQIQFTNSQVFEVHNLKSTLNIKFLIATYKLVLDFTTCHIKAQISQINSMFKFQNRVIKNAEVNQK